MHNQIASTTADAVLDRLCQLVKANDDSEAARKLGVSRSTFGSWRTRESIPYAMCVNIADECGISLDWLFAGKGPQFRAVETRQDQVEGHLLAVLRELTEEDQLRLVVEARRAREIREEIERLKAGLSAQGVEICTQEIQNPAPKMDASAVSQAFHAPVGQVAGRDIRHIDMRKTPKRNS